MSDSLLHYWLHSPKKVRPKPDPIEQLGQIGIWMILIGIALMFLYPPIVNELPDGYFTPILAYEFVENRSQVVQIFGEPGTYQFNRLVHEMHQGNLLDFVFMGLYTWFIWGFGEQFGQRSRRYLYILCALSPIILFADLLENMQLLSIPSRLTHENGVGDELHLLNITTWIKWSCIALSLALAGKFLLAQQGRFSRFTSLFCFASAGLGVLSYLYTPYIAELFGFSVFISFILLTIYCFKKKEHPPKPAAQHAKTHVKTNDTKAKG